MGSDLGDLQRQLKLHLPDYYRVGFWGYCSGNRDQALECTDPRLSFSFDLSAILRSASPLIDRVLPKQKEQDLSGYQKLSGAVVWLYILGLVSTVLTVGLGVRKAFCGGHRRLLTALYSVSLRSETQCNLLTVQLSAILVTVAGICVTAMFGALSHAINALLGDLGGAAQMGSSALAAVWMAVVFSWAALLVWLIQLCRRRL